MAEARPSASLGPGVLAEVVALATKVGITGISRDAEALGARLAEGRFYVACLGQFKRGKSTLLNAIVGGSVLPTGVAPVTSVVTVLRHGDRRSARVRTFDSGWEEIPPDALTEYVSEERNPGNAKGVVGVEVFDPSPLLRRGLCLVDTPGIGSVFAANTASTQEFLPQVDAALIVVGADPPITGEELALVEEVAARAPHLLFVLAKADRLSDVECEEALRFTKRILAQRLKGEGGAAARIFAVSAAEVLASGRPTRDWASLVEGLDELATCAGADLVARAEQRGVTALAARLVSGIRQQIIVLERPLAESEARLAALRSGVADAERALRDLAPLFAAEETRLMRVVERDREEWTRSATPGASNELVTALRFLPERGPALRRRALEEVTAVAQRWLKNWSAEETPKLDGLFREGMRRFVELLAMVERALVDRAGAESAQTLVIEAALRAPSQFFMTEMLATAPTSPGKQFLDTVGATSEWRSAAIRRDAVEYLSRLLEVNSARLKNDFRERLSISRRGLESEIRRRLDEISRAAERSLERARALHIAGRLEVEAELRRLRDFLEQAERLRARAGTSAPADSRRDS